MTLGQHSFGGLHNEKGTLRKSRVPFYPRESDANEASDLTLSVNLAHAAELTLSTGPLRSVVSRTAITSCP